MQRRARVTVNDRNAKGARLWAYGYADLAELFGVTEQTVRQWAFDDAGLKVEEVGQKRKDGSVRGSFPRPPRKRKFDPSDLRAVIRLAVRLHPEILAT